MKAFAMGFVNRIELIQDALLGEMADGGCNLAIYEDENSAKVAANFYTRKDRGDCGLQRPYTVFEVEIIPGKVLYTSKFEEEDEE